MPIITTISDPGRWEEVEPGLSGLVSFHDLLCDKPLPICILLRTQSSQAWVRENKPFIAKVATSVLDIGLHYFAVLHSVLTLKLGQVEGLHLGSD